MLVWQSALSFATVLKKSGEMVHPVNLTCSGFAMKLSKSRVCSFCKSALSIVSLLVQHHRGSIIGCTSFAMSANLMVNVTLCLRQ
uniref:Secreted protein n=1 Tax=Panagrellus redivivus TaxID=6233 RepID=A0A7E4W7A8_PANRE